MQHRPESLNRDTTSAPQYTTRNMHAKDARTRRHPSARCVRLFQEHRQRKEGACRAPLLGVWQRITDLLLNSILEFLENFRIHQLVFLAKLELVHVRVDEVLLPLLVCLALGEARETKQHAKPNGIQQKAQRILLPRQNSRACPPAQSSRSTTERRTPRNPASPWSDSSLREQAVVREAVVNSLR